MSSRRDYDKESGVNRVAKSGTSKRKSRKPVAPPRTLNESSEEEYASSDSDLEDDLAMKAKDDSARARPSKPKQAKKKRRDGQSDDFPGAEENVQDLQVRTKSSPDELKVPAHVAILHSSVYHIGTSVIFRPAISSYIPTAYNMFALLDAMCNNLAENTHLHEVCPDFLSPVLFLYYGHVVYFHILRARAAAGSDILTRLEKRILTNYERVGPAESWPVAAPLVGFLQAMGAHKPADSYYSWIVPALPDFSRLTADRGLANLQDVPGMLRLPVIPALQKLLYNFGTGTATYHSGILYPCPLPLAENSQFVGIASSADDSRPFLAVTYNLCWNTPSETGQDYALIKTAVKRRRISRWNIPDVPNNRSLNTAEAFLGFDSNQPFDWMKNLLSIANFVNRFFPNSTNLSNVPALTTLGSMTHVTYARTPPTPVADTWYYNRAGITLGFKGFSNTDDGLIDTKLGIATSTNAAFPNFFPNTVTNADPTRSGPFFVDDANAATNRERNATFLCEGSDEEDPARRYFESITQFFDPTGGKKTT